MAGVGEGGACNVVVCMGEDGDMALVAGLGEGACGAESPGTRGVHVAVGEGDGGTAACTCVRVVEMGD